MLLAAPTDAITTFEALVETGTQTGPREALLTAGAINRPTAAPVEKLFTTRPTPALIALMAIETPALMAVMFVTVLTVVLIP